MFGSQVSRPPVGMDQYRGAKARRTASIRCEMENSGQFTLMMSSNRDRWPSKPRIGGYVFAERECSRRVRAIFLKGV